MDVPAPLARSAVLLRCPVCHGPLRVVERSLVCEQRHTYDVAKHGHVTLARAAPAAGDDAEMVAARVAVFDAGHYAPLTSALARAAASGRGAARWRRRRAARARRARESPGGPVVLDLGAGTGHHLAGVLDALPGALGIALDTSRPALRHAARAHADIAAVVADVWQALPLADATVDLVLDVFSPRNGAEMARVLKPGGAALVVIPTARAPRRARRPARRATWTRRRSSGSSAPSARTWSGKRASRCAGRWTSPPRRSPPC